MAASAWMPSALEVNTFSLILGEATFGCLKPRQICCNESSLCSNRVVVACSVTSVNWRFAGGYVRYYPNASANLQAREIVENALQLKGFSGSNAIDFTGAILDILSEFNCPSGAISV